jgi:hypothetical protein
MTEIRDYRDADAPSWLQSRLLSFVATEYYAGFEAPEGLGRPVTAFMHAPISLEASLRERFSRVHVCRQYVRSL